MEDVPGLPYQTIVREYEGNEAMSRLYAANDAERLAEQGWRVLYTSRVETTKESGCLSTLLQLALFHYTLPKEKRYVIRVTYALGVKHTEQSPCPWP